MRPCAVVLGTLAVGFGVGLMATAGYLISRAAEHPPILSLTVAIVGVRFFGLARPLRATASASPRTTSRCARSDACAAASTSGSSRWRRPSSRTTEAATSLARMVADVDALQGLYLRSLTPPLVALSVGAVCVGVDARRSCRRRPSCSPPASLAGGVVVPVLAARRPRAQARQAAARGELTAELVEVLRGAPELVVNGAEDLALARVARARRRARPARPP